MDIIPIRYKNITRYTFIYREAQLWDSPRRGTTRTGAGPTRVTPADSPVFRPVKVCAWVGSSREEGPPDDRVAAEKNVASALLK